MQKFYVDFNAVEDPNVVHVRLDVMRPPDFRPDEMHEGSRILVWDEGTECQAILRRGKYYEWVADLIMDTVRNLAEPEWRARLAEYGKDDQ